MKIFGHNLEFKSNGVPLFLGGVGVGFFFSKLMSRCGAVAKAILTRKDANAQTDEPVIVSGGDQRVNYELTLSGIGLDLQEITRTRILNSDSTQTDQPVIVSGGNERVNYELTLSGSGLDLQQIAQRRIADSRFTQTDEPVVVSLRNEGVTYELTLSGVGLAPQVVAETTNLRFGFTQTDDERTFYCELDQVNEEYPEQSLAEHSIQIGMNRFARYNLMLAMLAQPQPQNPMTRIELSEAQLNELGMSCGISLIALKQIWSDCRDRLLVRSVTDPNVNPDNPIQQIDDRFNNLFQILTNQVAYKSDPKVIQKRLKFLSLLELKEVWVKKFGKKT